MYRRDRQELEGAEGTQELVETSRLIYSPKGYGYRNDLVSRRETRISVRKNRYDGKKFSKLQSNLLVSRKYPTV